MTALVRAEWLKFRTTAVPWVLLGIAVAYTGLGVMFGFLRSANEAVGPAGSPWFTPTTPDQLRNVVGAALTGQPGAELFAMLVGVLCITTEFRHKTVTTAFLVAPRRGSFVASKLIFAALAGAVLGALLVVEAILGGALGLAVSHGSVTDLLRQVPAVAPGLIGALALYAVLGAGVGSLLTNQVAALIVTLGWSILGVGLLALLFTAVNHEDLLRWLPDFASAALANHSSRNQSLALLSWWAGGLVMLGYGAVFAGSGWAVMRRRDIT